MPSIESILSDVADTSQRLLDVLREQAAHSPVIDTNERRYAEWRGDLYVAARHAWPGLPALRTHPDTAALLVDIVSGMRKSGTLLFQRGDRWHVALDDLGPTGGGPRSQAATLAPMTHPTQESQRDVKVYQCPKCPLKDTSKHAITMHGTGLGDNPHPVDDDSPFPCPESECAAEMPTKESYKTHVNRRHRELYAGKRLCTHCLTWHDSSAARKQHIAAEHPETLEPPASADPQPEVAPPPAEADASPAQLTESPPAGPAPAEPLVSPDQQAPSSTSDPVHRRDAGRAGARHLRPVRRVSRAVAERRPA
ncbi:hypothetical protein AB0B89_35625, partial [Sphaerisporangium sp. NPDC049002]